MRVPLSWLREHCPTDQPAERLAESLTNHGVEVARILRPWAELSGVVVARVLDVRDHPDAERLCVATVDPGAGERTVVVGVRNMAPGDAVPYAPPGALLPGFGPLERRELRGVLSDGMLCSPKELAISPDHGGILVLPPDAPVGEDLAEWLELHQAVLDVEVNPNRPDILSIVGVAREMAAITGEDLRLPQPDVVEDPEKATDAATVEIRDELRCPRYLARVIRGVRVGPAPVRAQVRLTAAGMRPVSNVVDATNYAMLESGQPLHPFDLQFLAGPGIVVRTAETDERVVTLDGIERAMVDEDLLICDVDKPVAVAGVMGGASSEVSETTTDVLLESAHFQPVSILRTARRLGLRSEASIRFERGADPEAVGPAAARAAGLIAGWSGGTVLAGEIDVGRLHERDHVEVRPSRARLLLGMDLSAADIRDALGRLRLQAHERDEDAVVVEVPGYRADLEREADVIEEVGRMRGYDTLPSTLPGVRQAGGLTRDQRLRRKVVDVLVGAGLAEAVSSSFVPRSDLELFEDDRRTGIRVANPVSEDEGFLRTSLLPGLLRAARRAVANRRRSVRLFEVGAAFVAREHQADERWRLGVVLHGPAAEGWPGEDREQDYLDAKGVLEHLLASLGIERWSLGELSFAPFHPGRSTEVAVPGEPPLGEVAELHPSVAERFDLPGRVAVLELELAPLLAAVPERMDYAEVSRFPAIHRDLAYVVSADVPAGAVLTALREAGGELLDRALLFDVYEGDPLPAGSRSLAFSVDFRAPDRTLTDQEADAVVEAITRRLGEAFDAHLRTG